MHKRLIALACLAMLAGAFGPAQADTAADTGPLLARTVASTTLPGSGHSPVPKHGYAIEASAEALWALSEQLTGRRLLPAG